MSRRKTVGARELKLRLGSWLQQVQDGVTLVVTEHGRPVAEIRPIPAPSEEDRARLDRLVALGELSRSAAAPLAPFQPIEVHGPPLSQTLLDEREDRL